MTATQTLIEKISALPQEHLSAVEQFVDSLESRDTKRRTTLPMAAASSACFDAVWENDADAAYDAI